VSYFGAISISDVTAGVKTVQEAQAQVASLQAQATETQALIDATTRTAVSSSMTLEQKTAAIAAAKVKAQALIRKRAAIEAAKIKAQAEMERLAREKLASGQPGLPPPQPPVRPDSPPPVDLPIPGAGLPPPSDNTMLYVGGAAALLVGLMLMRRK
jgi:hypothetical protein